MARFVKGDVVVVPFPFSCAQWFLVRDGNIIQASVVGEKGYRTEENKTKERSVKPLK